MRIIEIIKNLFKRNKKNNNLLTEKTIEKQNKTDFVKNVDLSDIQECLALQKKIESNQTSVDDLSIFEVMDLIDLYNRQLNIV